MDISIIIPALNEEATIGHAVSRAWATVPLEVLVVDGGSQDATVSEARRQGARVLAATRGRSLQQDKGARAAAGSVLLFLHADNWLHPEGIQQIRRALADPKVLGGAFRQRIEARGAIYRLLERGNAARIRWWWLPFGDQGIFLRRATYDRLGGFPPVRLMEDLLLMRRFRRLARPVLLPGPLYVSPRRWQRHGAIRQTLRNWSLLAAERLGAQPDWLARFYPLHCDPPQLAPPAGRSCQTR